MGNGTLQFIKNIFSREQGKESEKQEREEKELCENVFSDEV